MMKSDFHPQARYRILSRIGQGGMGEVYRALDRLSGHVVALKRVRLPRSSSQRLASAASAELAETGQAIARNASVPAQGSGLAMAATLPGPGLLPTAALVTPIGQQETAQPGAQTTSPLEVAATMMARTEGMAPSAAKFPAPPEPQTDSEVQALRLYLTQEFRTLAGLRHPHIVSVLDYGFDRQRQPYFTMQFLAPALPLGEAACGQSVVGKVLLLLQVLQALTYLHRCGVLHRDLKPSNILVVSGSSGLQVKLLDFGLALLTRDVQGSLIELGGTVGYLAPELLLGAPPSVASDLFSVGVMACELLVGAHPTGASTQAAMLNALAGSAPIFGEDAALGPQLSAVLRQALSRNPTERFRDASQFMQCLAAAAGVAIPAETVEIRESFLQAAPFVARESEMAVLQRALEEATAHHGSVILVGGESGVGKSRLLEEVRTRALVRGIRVARGQAVDACAAHYQVWQGILRSLCLETALDDASASVLKTLLPELPTLLDRALPDPPELEPRDAQARLLGAIEDLICSQREPLLLLIEDLHWAEPACLAVLLRLLRSNSLAHLPILILCTYRNDERPTLPGELPGAAVLELPRFRSSEVEALGCSMLGDIGNRRDVIELLAHETEGNALFIVEVVRALAEDAGAMGRIGSGRIPSRIYAGGVQAVLGRRLKKVHPSARPLLLAAAVHGRELDLNMLRALASPLDERVDDDLAHSVFASVLEVHDNRWRFVHDRLRDVLLSELSAAELSHWHLQVAQALEQAYAADLGPHSVALGHHFELAGDAKRALPYKLQAGERALQCGAVKEALAIFEQTAALLDKADAGPAERAQTLRLLCRTYLGAGFVEESVRTLEKMIAAASLPSTNSPTSLLLDITRTAGQHVRSRIRDWLQLPPHPSHIGEAERAWLGALVDTHEEIGMAIGLARSPEQVLRSVLTWVSLAEELAEPERLAPAYNALGVLFSLTPISRLSQDYFRRSWELAARAPKLTDAVRGRMKAAEAFVLLGNGQWGAALEMLGDGYSHGPEQHDYGTRLWFFLLRCRISICRGQRETLTTDLAEMEAIARRASSPQFAAWIRLVQAMLALYVGDLAQASQLCSEARQLESQSGERAAGANLQALESLLAVRIGNEAEAHRGILETVRMLQTLAPVGNSNPSLHACLMEAAFELWRRSHGQARAETERLLRRALAEVRRVGAIFPICRSSVYLWHGLYAASHGQRSIGAWLVREAVTSAQRYSLSFDEGLAREVLAEIHSQEGKPELARAERRMASTLFERVGAAYYVRRVDEAQRQAAKSLASEV